MNERQCLERERTRLSSWLEHTVGQRPAEDIHGDPRYLRLLAVIGRLRVLNTPKPVIIRVEFAACPPAVGVGEMGVRG